MGALLVNQYTRIYRDHPEWFGRDSKGEIGGSGSSYGTMGYLDITHPEVEKYIYDTFRKLKGYGFEYFKIDFTQCLLLEDLVLLTMKVYMIYLIEMMLFVNLTQRNMLKNHCIIWKTPRSNFHI